MRFGSPFSSGMISASGTFTWSLSQTQYFPFNLNRQPVSNWSSHFRNSIEMDDPEGGITPRWDPAEQMALQRDPGCDPDVLYDPIKSLSLTETSNSLLGKIGTWIG